MKLTQLFLSLALLSASVASAASSYKVTLPSDLFAGDTQLKKGEYTMTLEGKQAVFKRGKESIQIPVFVEKNDKKFGDTTLEISGTKIQSIDLGGTDMKIMFRPSH
jgi:hypothetical protein